MNDVANDPDNQVWLTTRETCERLAEAGLPISRSALYGWRELGLLAWRKHGRDWRILAASVDAYTDVQKAASAREYFEAHDRMRKATGNADDPAPAAPNLQVEVIHVSNIVDTPYLDAVWVDCGGRGTWNITIGSETLWGAAHKQILEALHEMVGDDVKITLYWTRDAIRDWRGM